jgi:hypothetical protein
MQLQPGETEIQNLHERPAAIGRFPGHNHEIRRLNRAMRQIEERGRADCSDHLQSDAHSGVRRHRSIGDNPGIGRFAFEMFRDQREIIVLDADRQRFGNVNVIELLRRLGALF